MARPTSDEGATMVGYGMVVGFIALVAVAAAIAFGQAVAALFESALDSWP